MAKIFRGESFCLVDFGRLPARSSGDRGSAVREKREVFQVVTERERGGNQEEKKKKENQRKDSRELLEGAGGNRGDFLRGY